MGARNRERCVPIRRTGDVLMPKKENWRCNYDDIPELAVGVTQKVILCDEATLTQSLPDEKIFEYLKLIVNCSEARVGVSKYKVGSCCALEKPMVLCHEVHRWYSR